MQVSFEGWWTCSRTDCSNDHRILNICKVTELYTWIGWIIHTWYPNHNSIELLNNTMKYHYNRTSLVAQLVKNLPAVQETQVWSLGWEDPLEKEMANHSSIVTWKIPWTEEPSRLHGSMDHKSQARFSD